MSGKSDGINSMRRFNGIPSMRSARISAEIVCGASISSASKLDAMMAWDRSKGRWLLEDEFSYSERPEHADHERSQPYRATVSKP